MAKTKGYPIVQSGEEMEISWETQDCLIQCCDCSLVHRFRFTVKGPLVILQAFRDNRATAQLRRHSKGKELVSKRPRT